MKKLTALAALAITLGVPALADQELARPVEPPDLVLLCYPERKDLPRGNKPDVVEIWLSQKVLTLGASLYRVDVTPTAFNFGIDNKGWREVDEIDRLTGRLSRDWIQEAVPNLSPPYTGRCQNAE
jgi:hypothetical protein